jgi:hypothetical protein
MYVCMYMYTVYVYVYVYVCVYIYIYRVPCKARYANVIYIDLSLATLKAVSICCIMFQH